METYNCQTWKKRMRRGNILLLDSRRMNVHDCVNVHTNMVLVKVIVMHEENNNNTEIQQWFNITEL